ncbi:MAG: hypothetical protein ACKORM_00025, partial [Solirubrobacterales bacterium]
MAAIEKNSTPDPGAGGYLKHVSDVYGVPSGATRHLLRAVSWVEVRAWGGIGVDWHYWTEN